MQAIGALLISLHSVGPEASRPHGERHFREAGDAVGEFTSTVVLGLGMHISKGLAVARCTGCVIA
jgi:hypothetical protein